VTQSPRYRKCTPALWRGLCGMPLALRLSEVLGGTEARPPVAWLSPEWCDCEGDDFVFADQVHDGELELAWKDSAGSELVRKTSIRKLCCQSLGLLHGFVKSPAESRADGCEVRDLVEEFFTRLVDVSDERHR